MDSNLPTTEDQTPVQIAPPPTWADVTADPKFADLTPERQLVAFDRWHNDAFNHASQQDDWSSVKDQFNTKAAQAQTQLQQAAGGLTPEDARAKIATDAVTAAAPQTPEDRRAVFQALPPDVTSAFFNKERRPLQPDDKTFVGKVWDWDKNIAKNIWATVGQAGVGAVKGAVDFATPANVEPQAINPNDPKWIQDATQWSNDKSQAMLDWLHGVSNTLAETKKQIPAGLGITPEDQQSLSGQLGQAGGGLAAIVADAPIGITIHVADTFGKVYDSTKGNKTEAGARAAWAGTQDLLFMGLGSVAAKYGGKLVPKGDISQWAGKILAGTGLNISFSQLTKAGEAALDAAPGKRYEAFTHALSEINPTDIGMQAGFAVLGAKHSMAEAQQEVQRQQIEKLQRSGSPQTAAVAAELQNTPPVVDLKAGYAEQNKTSTVAERTAAAQEAPQVGVAVTHNRDGSESVTVNNTEDATPEQLTAMKAEIDKSELQPEQKAKVHEQLDQAIAAKQAPAEPTAPVAAPVTEATPVAETVKPPAPSDPNQFTPALRTADGEIIPVPKGKTHDETKLPLFEARANNPDQAAKVLEAEHGYLANGQFYSRNETGTALGQTDPHLFSSQRLRDLQTPAPVPTPTTAERVAAPAEPLAPAPAARPLAPIAREEAPAAPTEQEVKNQVLKARTPEEKTAAVQSSQDREVQLALESGQEPRLNDIAGRQGSREKVQETQKAVRAALAAKYPPETVPEGAKEIMLHNEVTGDKLPQIVEPKLDENGEAVPNTTVTRPKFTNDVDFTAQELAKGSTVLLPEDFKTADVNPAVKVETQPDGTRKVVSVESRYGTVDGPEGNPERGTVDYNAAYKADVGIGKAHKVVAMGDTAAHISDLNQAVGQELAQRGIASDALERFDTDNPDPTVVEASATKSSEATPLKVKDNFTVLDLLDIPFGDRKAAPLQRALQKIASSEKFPDTLREQAKKLLGTGHDFGNIKIRRVQNTGSDAAGWWDPNTRTITINVSAGHTGGIGNTILHEVAHDILHDNFIKPKNDVHKNAANLVRKIQQKLLRAAFRESVGRDATNVGELEQWADAQRRDQTTPELNPFSKYADRKYYGVSHPEELLATVGTEAPIRELAAKLAPVEDTGARPKTLLSQLYDAARRLFTGGKKTTESAFDQLMQSFGDLSVKEPGTPAGERGVPLASAGSTFRKAQAEAEATQRRQAERAGEPLSKKEQDDLQAELDAANTEEPPPDWIGKALTPKSRFDQMDRMQLDVAAVDAGYKLADVDKMTTAEVREILRKTEAGNLQPKIDSHAMLSPKGEIIPVPDEDHYRAMVEWLPDHDPALYEKLVKKFGVGGVGELGQGDFYKFMEDNGYTRVVHGGSVIYSSGKGKLPFLHRRMLEQAGRDQQALVEHDTGRAFREKIYDPEAILSKAVKATAEKEDLPSDNPNAVQVVTQVGKGGKVTRNLVISPDATRADLLAMKDTLPQVKGLSEADLKRMNEVIDSNIGPTTVLQTGRIAGSGEAGKRIAYGYDASGNIANVRAHQEANSVALDFGPVTKPIFANRTKAAAQRRIDLKAAITDRTAMPFIVEAGGDRHALEVMLDQVANAVEPPPEGRYQRAKAAVREAIGRPAKTLAEEYTPIVQHALDNFDRLNGKVENFKNVMKEQIARERGVGISVGELDNYVTRLLKTPGSEDKIGVASSATGGSRYWIKGRRFETLADAINKGYRPITEGTANATDIVELTHRRVESGERLVQQKLLENQLRKLTLANGDPILSANEYYTTVHGQTDQRIPPGYRIVQTGGAPIVVHNDVAPVFEALYGQGSIPGFIKATAGFLKRNTLVADTFHVGRIMAKELGYSKGAERVGYNKGLSLLEYSDKDLGRAVAAGEITQREADYARTNRPVAELLLKNGLNVGKVADNLAAQHAAAIPGLKGFNPWVFQKLSRGAMLQTAIHNYERNLTRFGGDSDKAARQTAVEYNEVFGNLQNQSIFKNKRFQDLSRAIVLAPNWAESQFMAELRGYSQLARAPLDIARGIKAGEGFGSINRLGTVARGQATVVLGMLALNQVLNYAFTGHSTFENKDGHIFDAFIPHANIFGGKQGRGFYLNPMEIAAEYAHMGHRYMSQHQTLVDSLVQIAENKLGPLGRSVHDIVSGTDYTGKSYATTGDRVRAAFADALPFPIGLTSVLEKDPRSPLLFRPTRQIGAGERQLLQSAGLKTTAELSPRSEIYALAHPFRQDKGYRDNAPAEYRELRSALDNDQTDNAQHEIQLLLDRGHTVEQLRQAVPSTPEKFTGTDKQEALFRKSLTPEQMNLYKQAQADHRANAVKMLKLLSQITPEQRKQSIGNRR